HMAARAQSQVAAPAPTQPVAAEVRPEPARMHGDVKVQPAQPRAALFQDVLAHDNEPAADPQVDASEAFIPPAPERGVIRPPRLPSAEDFGQPAQNLLRQQAPVEAPQPVETRRMTLMQRLAAVGLGRREESRSPEAQAPVAPPQTVPIQPAPSATHAEYGRRPVAPQGYRPAAGQLDSHGRVANQAGASADEQLEIPAFLRRHSG
ncbi:MAG TPA: cell division protein FtsZ, partial [Beijerinckiaceae bacterium]|nr:cell division protein FtsZ [Beijerinckiaceae bacterium]